MFKVKAMSDDFEIYYIEDYGEQTYFYAIPKKSRDDRQTVYNLEQALRQAYEKGREDAQATMRKALGIEPTVVTVLKSGGH